MAVERSSPPRMIIRFKHRINRSGILYVGGIIIKPDFFVQNFSGRLLFYRKIVKNACVDFREMKRRRRSLIGNFNTGMDFQRGLGTGKPLLRSAVYVAGPAK